MKSNKLAQFCLLLSACGIAFGQNKRDQARVDLTLTDRTLKGNLAAAYAEAQAAQAQLTLLRYQAGEATVLEVVDAQATLNQARNAYDDGLARYAAAVATLQALTGTL